MHLLNKKLNTTVGVPNLRRKMLQSPKLFIFVFVIPNVLQKYITQGPSDGYDRNCSKAH